MSLESFELQPTLVGELLELRPLRPEVGPDPRSRGVAAWLRIDSRGMATLRLAQARAIVDRALAEARQRGLAPVAVAVLDPGGHLIAFEREDGAGFSRFDIANGKAWGALGMGFGTRELAERAAKAPGFYSALAALSEGRMVPSPGGVLIVGSDGEAAGAVGISGDTGDNDEACAVAGIEAAGFSAAPGRRAP